MKISELQFSATAALADLGVAETCKVTTCQPHLLVVRRGEWNEYFLIHFVANGAQVFFCFGDGKLLYALLTLLAFLR